MLDARFWIKKKTFIVLQHPEASIQHLSVQRDSILKPQTLRLPVVKIKPYNRPLRI
jgi:hypothetical protein